MFFNDLALYRKDIYKMLDNEYDCEWYIEKVNTGVKEFDESELKHVYRLPIKKVGPLYLVKGLFPLLKKDFNIYLVLGATRNMSLFFFCLIRRLFYPQKRIYFWTHGYYGKESKIENFLWKTPFFKLSDGIFTYGQYSKDIMIGEGFSPDIIHPIHNSLAYEEQLKLRNSIKPSNIYRDYFNNSDPVLIMIGRLNYRKHLDMLFEALSILKKHGENYNIMLIGDGKDRERLEDVSEAKGLKSRTWFYGACYDEGKNAELLFNSDMCVVPGDIGLTAIHSLMFGVPVITHNNFKLQGPEFEAIREYSTGAFYKYGQVEDLAKTISNWFEKCKDKREQIRRACYNEIDTQWNPHYQMHVFSHYLK